MKKNLPQKKNNPNRNLYRGFTIFFLVLTSIFFYYKSHPLHPAITEQELTQMLDCGEVKRVVLMKKEDFVKITLTQKALQQNKHQKRLKKFKRFSQGSSHYILKIVSPAIFDKHWQIRQTTIKALNRIDYEIDDQVNLFKELSSWASSILFFFLLWLLLSSGLSGLGKKNGLFGMGSSKAIFWGKENKVKITFKDVAGMPEAKEEIKEIVDFLKYPKKFTKLGGRIPKGALLVGAPGNGKTLLAKAVAGEAGVPFYSISGADFIEMFLGVGAARVRDLFAQAKKTAPSIIFIDEIDAIGRSRGRSSMGGNEERENTLNALLTEMDGFNTSTDHIVIVLAATNRVEILDNALLRPGRFDRQISIDNPTLKDREAIFKLHMKPLKLSSKVSAATLATQTVGFSGAAIANICNEAALWAVRKNRNLITMNDFQAAIDREIGGLEKKGKLISPKEKKIVAWHEAGHAVAAWFLEHAAPLVKVTIIPRGIATLGYAQYLPKEQFICQESQLHDEICVLLAGRVAEKMMFGLLSTGAQNDLERLTCMVYDMVSTYGMSSQVGNVSFRKAQQEEYSFTKPYAEATAQIIDKEVRKIIDAAYERVKNLLEAKKDALEIVAKALLAKEVLFRKDLEKLIGPRPFEEETATKKAVATKKAKKILPKESK